MKTICARCNAVTAELKAATEAHARVSQSTMTALPQHLDKITRKIDAAFLRMVKAKKAKSIHTDWHRDQDAKNAAMTDPLAEGA